MSNEDKNDKIQAEKGEPIAFFLGIIILCGGIFMIFKNTTTYSGFGYGTIFGGWNPPAGLVLLPLIVGVIILVATEQRVLGWLFLIVGLLIILLGILMSLQFRWVGVSLFETIMMFGLVAVGIGFILKGLYGKK